MDFMLLNAELLYQHLQGKRLKQYKAELVHSNYKKTPKNKTTTKIKSKQTTTPHHVLSILTEAEISRNI